MRNLLRLLFIFLVFNATWARPIPKGLYISLTEEEFGSRQKFITLYALSDPKNIEYVYVSDGNSMKNFMPETDARSNGEREARETFKPCNSEQKALCSNFKESGIRYYRFLKIDKDFFVIEQVKKNKKKGITIHFVRVKDIIAVMHFLENLDLDNIYSIESIGYFISHWLVLSRSRRLYSKPSKKSQIISELQLNQRVTVLEQTKVFITDGNQYAPWVKVKTKSGKIGYAFRGHLKPILKE